MRRHVHILIPTPSRAWRAYQAIRPAWAFTLNLSLIALALCVWVVLS